jgi:hypothetical protein
MFFVLLIFILFSFVQILAPLREQIHSTSRANNRKQFFNLFFDAVKHSQKLGKNSLRRFFVLFDCALTAGGFN